jgi:hypothetical protein
MSKDIDTVGMVAANPTVLESYVKVANNTYLVDPASSHMLISKIKPCMSKYRD